MGKAVPMNDPDLDVRPRAAEAAPTPRRRARWPWIVLLLLIAGLVLGLAALLDPATRARLAGAAEPPRAAAPQPADPDVSAAELQARIAALEAALAAEPAGLPQPPVNSPVPPPSADTQPLEARIAALEAQAAALRAAEAATATRLDQLANGLAIASGAAAEADRQMLDLLLLAVVRRHVEQGRPLGRLADVFAARFRGADAAAVDAIMAWGSAPQTRALLIARLDALALPERPRRDTQPAGFWAGLRQRLSSLITVRDGEADAATDPARFAAAREALEAGDIALAIARVEQLSPGPGREAWLADAALLLAAERGLERLETTLHADIAAREAANLPVPGQQG